MPVDDRKLRIALNESRFREINDRVIRDLAHLADRGEAFAFVCECGLAECRDQVHLTRDEYEAVRRDSLRFVVVPGHEIPDTEDVVERHERYFVIRKHEPVAPVVEATDPRTDEA